MQSSSAVHIALALTVIVFCAVSQPVLSQGAPAAARSGYPTKPIRIVDAFAPGGGSDVLARLMAPKLAESWGQQVIVDNRGGAGGTVGAEMVVRSPPDGYTVLIATGSYSVNPSVYKLSFDSLNDVTVIGQVTTGPFLVAVHPSLPVKNIKELVALAKAKPGALNFGSAGTGSLTHLATEFFKLTAHVNMTHIPYKGTGPALVDLLGGQIQLIFAASAAVMPHVKSGRTRAIAVTTPKRIVASPELPTVSESGVPGYDVTLWYSLLGPKGLPRDIVTLWNREVNRITQMPEMINRLATSGLEPMPGSPEAFAAVLKRDVERWATVVKQAGIKLD